MVVLNPIELFSSFKAVFDWTCAVNMLSSFTGRLKKLQHHGYLSWAKKESRNFPDLLQ